MANLRPRPRLLRAPMRAALGLLLARGVVAVALTPAGGFVLAGELSSYNDPAVLRIDALGNPTWAQAYDDGGGEQGFYAVQPTPDGGVLAGGIFTVRLDAAGNVLWSKLNIG